MKASFWVSMGVGGCLIAGCGTSTPPDTAAAPNSAPAQAKAGEVPSDAALQTLVKDSLLDFNSAIQKKDFTEFHGHISEMWQKQITPAELKKTFEPFIDSKVDLAPAIQNKTATFDPAPSINSDKILVVTGYYPTLPSRLNFTMKYLQEKDQWKAFGLNVNLKKPEAGAAKDSAPAGNEAPAKDAPAKEDTAPATGGDEKKQ